MMIHHVSISACRPQHVAKVFAELMGGRSYPYPGGVPDSWMAVSGDRSGTMVEVYPTDVTLAPGRDDDEQVIALREQTAPASVPFHFLLSVPATVETIEQIGQREGWRTKLYGRGAPGKPPSFHVVEVWVENTLMVELAPEPMVQAYTDLIQIPILDHMDCVNQAA